MKSAVLTALTAVLACAPVASQADDHSKVNGSIHIGAGETADDVSTVNGSISIDDDARAADVDTVNGSVKIGRNAIVAAVDTVNGRVKLDESARAGSVETVNGSITLASKAHISGTIDAVNGAVRLEQDAVVTGDVANRNGAIELDHAQVGGGLRTTNGDIEVGAGSRVGAGILVEKPSPRWFSRSSRPPRIVIGPGAVVEGALRFEHEVELYVSNSAKIGPVQGAKAIMFSGDSPSGADRSAADTAVEK